MAGTSLRVPPASLMRMRARLRAPSRCAWRALLAILAVGVATGLVFGLWPALDIAITARFYDPAQNIFPLTYDPAFQAVRDVNQTIGLVVAIFFGVVLIARLAVPERWVFLPRALTARAAAFVLAALAIAPGLIINGILKPHGGRPRPIELQMFGGPIDFVPWYSPYGQCPSNCSFASGEMSSAIWLVSVAVLLPRAWRPVGAAAVLLWALAVGGVRIAMGGHFTSDVLMSAVLTALTVWVLHLLIVRPAEATD